MRQDLSPGKAAAQAIHGALDAYLTAHPDTQNSFLANGHGPVVVLTARDETALRVMYALALSRALPCALFVDQGDAGAPHVTCLGLGPVTREDAEDITGELALMR